MFIAALPPIARALGVTPMELSFGVTAFYIAHAILLPACGWLIDRIGAKTGCLFALAAFALFSALTALSSSLAIFVICRFLQGGAAALMLISARNILLAVTDDSNRLNAMTWVSMPMLLAPTLGPPLGGIIVTWFNWRAIFLVNIPVAILAAAMIAILLPSVRSGLLRRFDWAGFLLVGGSLICLISALGMVSNEAPFYRLFAGLLTVGTVLGVAAYRHCERTEHPIFDFSVFRTPTFRMSTIGSGLGARIAFRGLSFVLIIMLQLGLGISVLKAAFIVLAVDAGDLVTKPFVSPAIKRIGYRNALFATSFIGAGGLLFIAIGAGNQPIALLICVLVVIGAARGILFSGTTGLTYVDIRREQHNMSSVVSATSLQLGNALAVAFVSIILLIAGAVTGRAGADPGLAETKIAILALGIVAAISAIGFRSLPKTVTVGRPDVASLK
nr:MFS transporter [Marinicaulis flavus]